MPHLSSRSEAITPVPSVLILTAVSVLVLLVAFHLAAAKISSSNPESSLEVSAQLTPFGSRAILTVRVYNTGSTDLRLDSISLRCGAQNIPLNPNPVNLNILLRPGRYFENSYVVTPASINPGDEFLVVVKARTPSNVIIEGASEVRLL